MDKKIYNLANLTSRRLYEAHDSSVITLTTVGYGDVYPITVLGKIIGGLIAMLGIGLFALPAGIIASGFAAELQAKPAESQICPHCGKELNS